MRLCWVEIENFRGVRSLDWRHIGDTAALVGPGDSGKSTILDAIERVLSPKYVAFDDTDFWDLNTDAAIVIRATITDPAPSFYRDSKFGLFLHAFDKDQGEVMRAEGRTTNCTDENGGSVYAMGRRIARDAAVNAKFDDKRGAPVFRSPSASSIATRLRYDSYCHLH
jgi:energy-coupling factor transporter ATP-binding protein EcfA2